MTGIFICISKNPGAMLATIKELTRDIKHRGRYHTQIFHDQSTDIVVHLNNAQKDNLVVESDPMENGNDSIIVLDGKIDNLAQLSAYIGERDDESKNALKLVRRLYQLHGTDVFTKISGQYAFVIKEKDTIVAAKDPVGSKPLYILDDDDMIVIASELRSFRGFGKTPRFLEPGTAFITDGQSSRTERFFDARSLVSPAKAQIVNVGEATSKLYSLLDGAVKRSISPDSKVAALLSGGVDSSIICALALQYLQELDAYIVTYEGSQDLVYARLFSDHYAGRVNLQIVEYSLEDMLNVIPDVIRSMETYDAALIRSAMPMYIACSKILAGTDILLTGEGSDELFGGYSYLEEITASNLDEALLALLEVEHATGLQRVDRIPYHFGIEARAPWFDMDLVRFAFTIPPEMKIRHEQGGMIEKWITREAFKSLLPAEITWRKKAKFSQGAGSELVMRDYLAGEISDEDYLENKEIIPSVFARSKEELYYWRVFKEYFNPTAAFIKTMPRTEQFTV